MKCLDQPAFLYVGTSHNELNQKFNPLLWDGLANLASGILKIVNQIKG